MQSLKISTSNQVPDPQLVLGLVYAEEVKVQSTPPELKALLDELIQQRQKTEFPTENLKNSIRDLLRRGGYKPSGRGKPASEYLAQAAREGRFPFINNLVDINNYISLKSALPISLLDASAVGPQLVVRYGSEGESYVFNSGGQVLDLKGLLVACSGDGQPLGNAVKDSMAGKIKDHTQSLLAVFYGALPETSPPVMSQWTAEFAQLLKQFAHTDQVATQVLTGAPT